MPQRPAVGTDSTPGKITSPNKAANYAAQHRSKHHAKQQHLSQWFVLLLCAAAVGVLTSARILHAGVRPREQPIQPHLDAVPVEHSQHVASERMLRMLIEECAKREESVIWVDPQGSMVVQNEVDPQQCPVMDIMLKKEERGVGMCTDVMLYVLHMDARLIGAQDDMPQYNSYCGPATARLLMETMYAEFISRQPGVLNLMLVNAEHLWNADTQLHKQMDAFLCKTEVCVTALQQHVARKHYKAGVWFMGHTSSDPTVDLPPDATRKCKFAFLHVKGKSGLKHTRQLLECWRDRPDLPTLTVVGRFAWNEVKDSVKAQNIVLYPKVTEAFNNTQTEHISFAQVRKFQSEQPIHICASEREGFGHYLNEARAAGAFIISTDHPPMNEFVTQETGYLITPEHTNSYDVMALGRYMHINAFLNASQLCMAVDAVMTIPFTELEQKGQLARQAYLRESAIFLERLKDLKTYLEHHAEAMHITAGPRAGLWRQQLRKHVQSPVRRLSSQPSYEPG